jgi:hypothetical protein
VVGSEDDVVVAGDEVVTGTLVVVGDGLRVESEPAEEVVGVAAGSESETRDMAIATAATTRTTPSAITATPTTLLFMSLVAPAVDGSVETT